MLHFAIFFIGSPSEEFAAQFAKYLARPIFQEKRFSHFNVVDFVFGDEPIVLW